jgi:hypothetical protein
MRFYGFCLLVLLMSAARLPACQLTDTNDADLAAQVKALNDKIEELRARQNALAEELKRREAEKAAKQQQEELARQQREEAEKKLHYAKVEIRGKLIKMPTVEAYTFGDAQSPLPSPATNWYITINQLSWKLNLPADQELLNRAEKLNGKSVIVTGTVVNVQCQPLPYAPPTLPIQPYLPGEPPSVTPTLYSPPGLVPHQRPNQNPDWVDPSPYPMPQPTLSVPRAISITVNVDSLKAVEQ